MRFRIPATGEERDVKRFAWFPVRVGTHRVWLERYRVHQRRQGIKQYMSNSFGSKMHYLEFWEETSRCMIPTTESCERCRRDRQSDSGERERD